MVDLDKQKKRRTYGALENRFFSAGGLQNARGGGFKLKAISQGPGEAALRGYKKQARQRASSSVARGNGAAVLGSLPTGGNFSGLD